MKSNSESYKNAGVDIEAGYEAVSLMQTHVAKTLRHNPNVLSGLGGFGGMVALDVEKYPQPVLVSGTDGVGTKLKIAFLMDKHDTIGIDCVAMCVNDIICCGAVPQFFLDYIACGKTIPQRIAEIVAGISEGCVQAGCALVGGETAEMPGVYALEEYDLAGFAVGVVNRPNILDKTTVRPGDILLALPSSGFHSNGFSLLRKIFDVEAPGVLSTYIDELQQPLGEALLTPTRIYVQAVLALHEQKLLSAIAHITGGGFYENIPRALPAGRSAKIETAALRIPPIFDLAAKQGKIDTHDMFNTFNMGVGMCAVVAPQHVDAALACLSAHHIDAYVMGEVVTGDDGVLLW